MMRLSANWEEFRGVGPAYGLHAASDFVRKWAYCQDLSVVLLKMQRSCLKARLCMHACLEVL